MKHKEVYTNCLAFQLTQARKNVFAWYESYLKPLGLTPNYVYVLGVLKDVQQATPSKISELLELERSTVTTLLSRMEKSGLIEKGINPENRRESWVRLTMEGEAVCEQAYPRLIEADEALNQILQGNFEHIKGNIMGLNQVFREGAK